MNINILLPFLNLHTAVKPANNHIKFQHHPPGGEQQQQQQQQQQQPIDHHY